MRRWLFLPFALFALWKAAVFGIVALDPVVERGSAPRAAAARPARLTVVRHRTIPRVRYVREKKRRDYYLILAAVFVALLLRHYTATWPAL